ncbi:GntR family transcriptional regulator [Microlunatus flavus]|uniref:DNA-binding transcriptional regulator, GntR family n=1 Tax=Microlunatus flavus TaxID=1036181 RepID=A0A1H9FEH9_9ACTN|nr:GntR family transcriptional regulator [Microlunatus flavus]SEQ36334.1 DNA-binding transcriptional regulator, GntR family [Microlunatus flavus]
MLDPAVGLHAPSLVEVATRQLREEILSGALQPGERLVEEQVVARFSISRPPLREALRVLAQQGLVEHVPRRGARVTELSATDVEQLFGIRLALEVHAVRTTFPMDPPPDDARLARLQGFLDQMRVAQRDGDELTKDDAHRAFHAEVVALAGNRQLDLALEPVLLKPQRPMASNLRREAHAVGPEAGLRRHQDLVDAIRGNDVDAVLHAVSHHGSTRFL